MYIDILLKKLEELLPSDSAIEGDKIGIQLKSSKSEISKILVTMEITDEVVIEAIEMEANLIITFHPLIFNPMQQILHEERVGRIVQALIKHDISVFSVHTAFDVHPEGTNLLFAEKLGLKFESFILPDKKYADKGMGIIAKYQDGIELVDLVSKVSDLCKSPVRYTVGKFSKIFRIAIICGSGSSFYSDVLSKSVDAFITADVSYHTFHRAKGNLALIDPGHFEMEQFVNVGLALLISKISNEDEKLIVKASKIYTNPVEYFTQVITKIEQKNNLSKI